jgi:hypothetical protein
VRRSATGETTQLVMHGGSHTHKKWPQTIVQEKKVVCSTEHVAAQALLPHVGHICMLNTSSTAVERSTGSGVSWQWCTKETQAIHRQGQLHTLRYNACGVKTKHTLARQGSHNVVAKTLRPTQDNCCRPAAQIHNISRHPMTGLTVECPGHSSPKGMPVASLGKPKHHVLYIH